MGVFFVCLLKLIHIFSSSNDVSVWEQLGSSIYIYYFTGVLTYILFAVSFCVYIFKCYSINYLVIFEINQHHASTYVQYMSAGCILLTIWMLCFTLQLSHFIHYPSEEGVTQYFTFLMCALFLFFFANPFKKNYYDERIALIKALEQCFISPLGIG